MQNSNAQLEKPKTFGKDFEKSYHIIGYRSNHYSSMYMSAFSITEKTSVPKPLKVTDGISIVDIVVDSIENLEAETKQALILPQSIHILIKTQDKPMRTIESRKDIENLESNKIISIIHKGPIN